MFIGGFMNVNGYKKNKYYFNKCNNLSNNIHSKNKFNNCNNCNNKFSFNSLFEIENFLCCCNKAIRCFKFCKFFK